MGTIIALYPSLLFTAMLKNLFGSISKDLGIDFGTHSTIITTQDNGIVIHEPSVVSINEKTGEIIAVGEEARDMIGKTPPHITTHQPLIDGVVSDFEVAEKMLKHFINQIHRETFSILPRPRVIISAPLNITEVERKAIEDAVMSAGGREALLVEEPMAAAIGSRIPIQDSTGHMVVNIGAGTTGIAVISLSGIVMSRSLRVGGDELNRDIINYIKDHFKLLLGDKTAEQVKVLIGSAHERAKLLEAKVRGRDMTSGLPKEIVVNSSHLREAMSRSITNIIDNIRSVIEHTPPELVADIYERGILLSGGTAHLRGLDYRIAEELDIPVKVADDPVTAVVRGTGILLENIDAARSLFEATPPIE